MTASAADGRPGFGNAADQHAPVGQRDNVTDTEPDSLPLGSAGGDENDMGQKAPGEEGWARETREPTGTAHPAEADGHTGTGLSNIKVAMWAFLGSECLLFGALIATFFLYRGRSQGLPKPHDVFDIPFTSVSSFILLMSSLTLVLGHLAMKHGKKQRSMVWLGATALLGAIFLGGQIYEFTEFIRAGVTMSTNPASSAFYTLTGFHGAHVGIGVLLLCLSIAAIALGKLKPRNHEVVEVIGLYWHFVDVVWIVVFTIVYLLPLPGGPQ